MRSSRWHLAILIAAVIVATAVATGAVPLSGEYTPNTGLDSNSDHEQDHAVDDVVLEPHDGPNGAYTSFDNGTFAIELTDESSGVDGGLSPSSASSIEDVFMVTYVGSERATVWLESDLAELEFTTAAGPIGDSANATALGPNESVSVGFTVDGRDIDADEHLDGAVEINAETPESSEDPPLPAPGSGADPVSPCHPVSMAVDSPSESVRTVSLTDVQTCDAEQIPLQSLSIGDHVALESVALEFTTDDDTVFEVAAPRNETVQKKSPFGLVDELHAETGSVPVGSYTVSDLSDAVVEPSTHTLSVDRAWLERAGIAETAITVHQHDGQQWTEREGRVVDETDETIDVAVEADSAVLSAVGVEAPVLTVEDLTVDEDQVSGSNGSATVEATVRNQGPVPADATLKVIADGHPLTDRQVALDANESTEVSIELDERPDGESIELDYEYTRAESSFTVGSGSVGSDSDLVSDTDGDDDSTGAGDETAERSPASASGSGFGPITAAGIALVVAVVLLQRRVS